MKNLELKIAWLYPELMSTYGDRGNIIVLQKRAERRGIDVKIERVNQNTEYRALNTCDILFMGGAQDIQQEIVQKDLNGEKGEIIKSMVENNTPSLFICGAYQFMGDYYKDSYGTEIKGLGVFSMYTEAAPDSNRLIGSIIVKPTQLPNLNIEFENFVVGFENHGGRTYLSNKSQAFADIIKGHGNNGEDRTEGIHFKSAIGTYLHGPILPCNPELTDYFIESALVKKYGKEIKLKELDDSYARKAKQNILKQLKASY